MSDNTQTVSSNASEEYKDLSDNQYQCDKSVKLDDDIRHIQLVNNRLICTQRKGITIRSAESLKTLKSLTLDNISRANCSVVTHMDSYLVSSCEPGLCEVDIGGKQPCVFCPGRFISVNIKGNTVYSYDKGNNRVVCVKRCAGGTGWEVVGGVELQYGDGVSVSDVCGCVVTGDHIYVSWRGEESGERCDSVSKHDMSGRQVDRYGSYGKGSYNNAGLLCCPHISCVDGAGRMLVCDWANRRVLVCTDKGEWRVMVVAQGAEGWPVTATVANNIVWVGYTSPNYLHRYIVT